MVLIIKGNSRKEVEQKILEIKNNLESQGNFDYYLDVREIVTNKTKYYKATLQTFFKEYTWNR